MHYLKFVEKKILSNAGHYSLIIILLLPEIRYLLLAGEITTS